MKTCLRFVLHLAAILIGLSLFDQAHAKSTCPENFVVDGTDMTWSETKRILIEIGEYTRGDLIEARRGWTQNEQTNIKWDPENASIYRESMRGMQEVIDCHLANDPLLAEGATATSKLAEGEASAAQDTSSGNDKLTGCEASEEAALACFNRDMEAVQARHPMPGAAAGSAAGSRAIYQWTYAYATEGLKILLGYQTALGSKYRANYDALIGAQKTGREGCNKLSTTSDDCPAVYP